MQAQNEDAFGTKRNAGKSQAISFGIYLPVGNFLRSHTLGAGIDYSWSRHRFDRYVSPGGRIGFIVNGGVSYYIGEKIKTAGYDFRYGGYINIYGMPGLIYTPFKKANVALTAGPALNIYKAAANAGIAINFIGNYFVSDNITIGPAINYKKHTNTDALWAIAIRASYIF